VAPRPLTHPQMASTVTSAAATTADQPLQTVLATAGAAFVRSHAMELAMRFASGVASLAREPTGDEVADDTDARLAARRRILDYVAAHSDAIAFAPHTLNSRADDLSLLIPHRLLGGVDEWAISQLLRNEMPTLSVAVCYHGGENDEGGLSLTWQLSRLYY
jgi:hypothetical protein